MSIDPHQPNRSSAIIWQKRLVNVAIVLGVVASQGSFHQGTPKAVFTAVLFVAIGGIFVAIWLLYRHLVASGEVIVSRDPRTFLRRVAGRVIFVAICFGAAAFISELRTPLYMVATVVALIQIASAVSDFRRIER